MSKVFSKNSLASARPKFKDIDIETLGTVRLRGISTSDYYDLVVESNVGSTAVDPHDPLLHARMLRDLYPSIVAYAVIDEDGNKVFDGPKDPALDSLRPAELMAIGNEAYEFWGFAAAQPKIGTAVKN